jgi:hypothetical protein
MCRGTRAANGPSGTTTVVSTARGHAATGITIDSATHTGCDTASITIDSTADTGRGTTEVIIPSNASYATGIAIDSATHTGRDTAGITIDSTADTGRGTTEVIVDSTGRYATGIAIDSTTRITIGSTTCDTPVITMHSATYTGRAIDSHTGSIITVPSALHAWCRSCSARRILQVVRLARYRDCRGRQSSGVSFGLHHYIVSGVRCKQQPSLIRNWMNVINLTSICRVN